MLASVAPVARAQAVFSSSFDATMPSEITGSVAQLTPVQGFAGLGNAGRTFGGSFLRSPTGNTVTIQLTNLPPHQAIDIRFLFAAIDSLDGTGSFPEGDFLRVTVDGQQIFRESFANATQTQDQTYVAPPGAQLARRVDLGFSGPGSFYTDSAYDMGADGRFQNIAHTASTLTISFVMEGPGIQDLSDESWAMDELTISLVGGDVCDSIDFNRNDVFPEDQDVIDFFEVLAGSSCPYDPPAGEVCDIDFNNNGVFPEDQDVVDFLTVLAGGTCG
ncbi:MAG: PEP-CTERM sorting domain-containing protein [Phycisphaerae bacterium]|jgi:hypothetical protein